MSSQEIKRVCTRSLAPRDFINANKVKVVIDEQPCGKVRYDRRKQGGQAATPLLGAHSKPGGGEKKSYPSLRVLNCRGPGLVLVSLVTEQAPYYPHPNRLARLRGGAADGKCQNGVYLSEIDSSGDGEGDTMKVVLKNLAIQRVDERDVAAELEIRKRAKVDPFQTGYEHASETSKIDLGCVRMCFQVFLKNKVTQKFDVMLDPVVSEPILDTSAENDISIQFASHASDSVIGGTEMCLLCKRLDRDDIKVVFFDDESGWKSEARLSSPGVWNRCALLFKVPTYCDPGIEEPRQVTVQLRRPSDGAVSQAVPFTYRPAAPRTSGRKRKRDPVFEETTGDLERLAAASPDSTELLDERLNSKRKYKIHPVKDAAGLNQIGRSNVLEIGAEWSIATKDVASFERYMSLLKVYYYDYASALPASAYQYQLLGLNLLHLLSQNRVAESHGARAAADRPVPAGRLSARAPQPRAVPHGGLVQQDISREAQRAGGELRLLRRSAAGDGEARDRRLPGGGLRQDLAAGRHEDAESRLGQGDPRAGRGGAGAGLAPRGRRMLSLLGEEGQEEGRGRRAAAQRRVRRAQDRLRERAREDRKDNVYMISLKILNQFKILTCNTGSKIVITNIKQLVCDNAAIGVCNKFYTT
ncbi:unnamed protein product [Trichogramma brassicae]|uniref:RHD domain-containing protein n=1 Tax=Trichogramma brassicae TaxID=86971 RepID=A0A6H5J3Y8_9HYME|nr:unnamed protein product [Trichogramma brassicae]